jgi:hypothetical protein
MRVKFTYSQEDLVDASMRFVARSKALRSARRKRSAWWAVFAGLVIVALSRFSIMGVLAGMFVALVALAIDPFTHGYQVRRNLRRIYEEQYGEENEFVCEVELLPESLKTSGRNSQCRTEWETIDEIMSTKDSVDIVGRKGGGVIVRNRAFSSAEERQRFIELAREYMNLAKAAGKPVK